MAKAVKGYGSNAVAICDCGHDTFHVGVIVTRFGSNFVRVVECAKCGHQMPVPFQQGKPATSTPGEDAGLMPEPHFLNLDDVIGVMHDARDAAIRDRCRQYVYYDREAPQPFWRTPSLDHVPKSATIIITCDWNFAGERKD